MKLLNTEQTLSTGKRINNSLSQRYEFGVKYALDIIDGFVSENERGNK